MINARKSLIVLFCIVGVIALLRPLWGPRYEHFFNSRFNSQWKHLRQIEAHIEAVRPKWNAFTNENAGFEEVHLFAYTGGDGLFGAYGYIEEEQLLQLRAFMEQTVPPRPIYLEAVQVVDPQFLDILRRGRAEPGGAASGQRAVSLRNKFNVIGGWLPSLT